MNSKIVLIDGEELATLMIDYGLGVTSTASYGIKRTCALAARANLLVTRDDDLLDLGKPFGVEIVTPVQFLAWLRAQERS